MEAVRERGVQAAGRRSGGGWSGRREGSSGTPLYTSRCSPLPALGSHLSNRRTAVPRATVHRAPSWALAPSARMALTTGFRPGVPCFPPLTQERGPRRLWSPDFTPGGPRGGSPRALRLRPLCTCTCRLLVTQALSHPDVRPSSPAHPQPGGHSDSPNKPVWYLLT